MKEMERCEVNDPSMNGGSGCYSYNQITIEQSSAYYEIVLRELYQRAVDEWLAFPKDHYAVIAAEVQRIQDRQVYFDIPTRQCLKQHEQELALRYDASLKKETDFIRHILSCAALQKYIFNDYAKLVQQSVKDVKNEKTESKSDVIAENDSSAEVPAIAEQQEMSDWMDIDQVCKYFKLPKNKIKSRKWRIENNFPCHTKPYEKVIFHRAEVEEWLKNRKKK